MNNRLKKALKVLSITHQELADKLNLPKQKVSEMTSGRKKITPELATQIEAATGISAAWLMLEKGGMFDKYISGALDQAMRNGDIDSRVHIKYYPDIKASAGSGYTNTQDAEVEIISVPAELLGRKISHEKLDAIKVHGDSMEPTVKNGDVVFICKKEAPIIDGKIYVINYNNEIYLKRIFKRKNSIIIKSDNPIYPQDEINVDDVKIIGKLIFNMTAL